MTAGGAARGSRESSACAWTGAGRRPAAKAGTVRGSVRGVHSESERRGEQRGTGARRGGDGVSSWRPREWGRRWPGGAASRPLCSVRRTAERREEGEGRREEKEKERKRKMRKRKRKKGKRERRREIRTGADRGNDLDCTRTRAGQRDAWNEAETGRRDSDWMLGLVFRATGRSVGKQFRKV